jgi:hypothetical protein
MRQKRHHERTLALAQALRYKVLAMHASTKRQTGPQILVPSKFGERRMEIITLMWIGFWMGILLGGISVLLR